MKREGRCGRRGCQRVVDRRCRGESKAVRADSTVGAVGSAASVKITRRLIPFMFVLYVVAFPDRINVGFAALQMNEDLGLGEAVYGLGAGMFFLRYLLFEMPSNPPPGRIGARARTGRILIT